MQAIRPAATRAAPRTLRSLPTRPAPRTFPRSARQARRHASTEASPAAKGGSSGALAGGLAGGAIAVLLGYTWYHVSGTRTLVNSAHQTKSYLDNAFKQTTEKAPKPSEAVEWLRDTVKSYTKMIPGAGYYVDQAFEDIEKIQKKHGGEVEKIVKEAYDELKDVTKAGASMAAGMQAFDILGKAVRRIGSLAGDAADDILDNHPQLKEKVGGQYKQLQQMAKSYGPEAQKQVDETVGQVKDIIQGGLSTENIEKAKKLVEEKVEEIKKYGNKAWDEGIKKAQPILDKQPELKEYIEKNKDKLLQGDLGKLWEKVQSGNADDIKKFVQQQVEQGQKSVGAGKGLEGLLGMFPGGQDISGKLKQLQELSEKHGKDAEKLVKSAFEDIKGVLDKKVEEGKDLKEKAEKDAKS